MTQWNTNGQLLNAFALNLGLVGAAPTATIVATPWTGGAQTGIPDTASAWILAELPHTYAAPMAVQSGQPAIQTSYNFAVREYWRAIFLKNAGGCTTTEEVEPVAAPAGGLVLGFADGHAKFYQVKRFLAETPTLAEYNPGASFPANMGSNCRNATNAWLYTGGSVVPNLNINYPLWGLGQ